MGAALLLGGYSRAKDVLQKTYLRVVSEAAVLKTWWFGVVHLTAHEEFRRWRFRYSLIGRMIRQFEENSAETCGSAAALEAATSKVQKVISIPVPLQVTHAKEAFDMAKSNFDADAAGKALPSAEQLLNGKYVTIE